MKLNGVWYPHVVKIISGLGLSDVDMFASQNKEIPDSFSGFGPGHLSSRQVLNEILLPCF